ncbi:chloride channel protein [Methanospirillum lacunae]|uniref:Chloride channel protein n=1 Tax=Methanospirillum lacunae TaxID=668570 RepID=A0A2V2N1V4_9EURY|nr:chloride channel protein [Methanospirillum lacunae]PWR72610.1 chloride channel protein [Methanospirillum lacunae]
MFSIPSFVAPTKRILIIAIVVGIIAGIGSLLFFEGLKWGTAFFMGYLLQYTYPQEGQTVTEISQWSGPHSLTLLIPILCFGSLLTGILVTRFAPEAEGHGTDAAIKAFHGEGKIRRRIPLLKALTAILTISTGGSAGREGPSAQISAGFGSLVAELLHLTPAERRIALTTGIGAGIGTIFKAPLGGAILAAEVLYTRDFESEAIVPAFLASIIGYSIFGLFEGYSPIFILTSQWWTISQIPMFILLGILCAGFGHLYIFTFYGTRDIFSKYFKQNNLPAFLKPVSGAILLGIIVIVLARLFPDGEMLGLASMGSSYGYTQLMFYSMVPLSVLILLPFMKIIATSLTLGSGGSGGVFAPGLTIGAAIGGALGTILHIFYPTYVPIESVPVFVVVGMISLFGAVANAPIAVLMMVVEMVGSVTILVPAMAAVAVSNLLTGENTIFRQQVQTKAQSGAHRGEYDRETLEGIHVKDAMSLADNVITLSPGDQACLAKKFMAETEHTGYPVLDQKRLVGIVTNHDMRKSLIHEELSQTIRDIMTTHLHVVTPESTLEDALVLMVTHSINHLPVVDRESSDHLVGFLTRTDILKAYSRNSHGCRHIF